MVRIELTTSALQGRRYYLLSYIGRSGPPTTRPDLPVVLAELRFQVSLGFLLVRG